MSMPNRKWQGSSTYRFDFNGKEKDPETELNDFGARFYAANIGRWLSIDPLAAKFPNWSPYNAMNDNPIKFIDPDGRDVKDPTIYTITYSVTIYKNVEVVASDAECLEYDPLSGGCIRRETYIEKQAIATVDFVFILAETNGQFTMLSAEGDVGNSVSQPVQYNKNIGKVEGSASVAKTPDGTKGGLILKVNVELKNEGFAITLGAQANLDKLGIEGLGGMGLEIQKNVETQSGSGSVQVIIPFDGTDGYMDALPKSEKTSIFISDDMQESQNSKQSQYGVDVHLIKVEKKPIKEDGKE